MEKLAQTHSVEIQWRSFELRPSDAPPLPPDYMAKIEAGRPRMYAIAREQYGIEMNPGPFGFNSRPALIGAKYVEAQGRGPAYHAAMMRAYWQEACDIGNVDTLTALAARIGLDAAPFRTALDDPHYQQAVDADIEQARLYGIQGVPALVFGQKYLISGAQPYEILARAVDQVQSELD